MPADNKERGSIHAGGGVAANSWQLFKYLLSLSPPFLYISTLVSVETQRRRGVGVGGLISLPPSISNSLCSPHASRGSDLTLPRRKADPLQCFITWWSGWLNALPGLLLFHNHTARLQKAAKAKTISKWTVIRLTFCSFCVIVLHFSSGQGFSLDLRT